MYEDMKILSIKSFKGEYTVCQVSDFLSISDDAVFENAVFFIDANVMRLHYNSLQPFIQKNKYLTIEPTESRKSYQQLEPIIDWLIRIGFKKNQRLVAIGGGILQDITAFIASIIYRGVEWVFIPTTLLSQADSCIGSKTSINFGSFKNQIGSFHPPVLILLWSKFLQTLANVDIRSGLGEIMHYFLISGYHDMELIRKNYDAALFDFEVLIKLIRRSLEIKKSMIEIDEFDKGPRNIFNYGHSFGHALESYTDYSIPHGIAVSFGMDIANILSVHLGLMNKKEALEMRLILQKNWFPCDIPEVDVKKFVEHLQRDKKNVGRVFRFVLSRGPGKMKLYNVKDDEAFREVIKQCFHYYHEAVTNS